MHIPRLTSHAAQRLGERGIQRRWVVAALRTAPVRYGRHAVFYLNARQLNGSFGTDKGDGLRVVTDEARGVVVTVHWHTTRSR